MPMIDPAVLAEIRALEAAKDYQNPRYMELLMQHHYVSSHPACATRCVGPTRSKRTFKHLNQRVYVPMQGPSELGRERQASHRGTERADLGRIAVPTMTIGAGHDHDGSGAHETHGRVRVQERAISRLSGWQPHWRCSTISSDISQG